MTTAALFGFLAGLVLGLAYFAALAAEARAWARRAPWLHHLLLLGGRLAAALLVFGLLVQYGAASLLAGFAGFLVARQAALRFQRP